MFITFSSADVQMRGCMTGTFHIFMTQILRQRSKLTSKAARSHNSSPASALMPTELWSCGFEQQTPDLRSCTIFKVQQETFHEQKSFRPERRIIVSSEIKLASNWKVLIDTITSNCAHTLRRGFIFIKLHKNAQILLFDAGILLLVIDVTIKNLFFPLACNSDWGVILKLVVVKLILIRTKFSITTS